MRDFSTLRPEKQIDRIHADREQRDGSYKMPKNHYHPYFELYYLESGRCRFFIGNRMLDLQGGDLLLIPPRTLHYTRYLFGSCARFDVFFRPGELEKEIRGFFPEGEAFFRQWRLMQIPDFYREAVSTLFGRMVSEEKINDERTALLLKYRLQDLLLAMSRVALFSEAPPTEIHTTDRAVVQAAAWMREHLREPLKAGEIAAAAGFSPNYLSRKFRQATGMGVHEYLIFLRLQQAALELAETKETVTEIALRCGFSDGNYFKDCFRKRYGVSPREYRKGEKQENR